MTDLRQAAQAVIDRWDSPLWKNGSTADAIADLRAALEQQAEPVAWMAHQDKMLPTFHRTFTAARDWADNPTPLYTAPPQRKPLTDEEIEKHWKKWVGTARPNYSYTRAIEQAHGIKEGT